MVIGAHELLPGASQPYHVCIVGAGPAGLAVGLALRHSGIRFCVVESGLRAPDTTADSLKELDSNGIRIKWSSRERVLGGSSTTWAGLSRPLEVEDFLARPWVPHSGWPITRGSLTPYYQAASRLARFPALELFDDPLRLTGRRGEIPAWQELSEKIFLASEPPQNFGTEHGRMFEDRDRDLVLGATVTEIIGNATTGDATGVVLALDNGTRATVYADAIVLASGGIENARLLLNSSYACPEGLGNDRDQVGRYFMNHPKANYGAIELSTPVSAVAGYLGFLPPENGLTGFVGFRLAPEVQRREAVLNPYVRFEPVFDWADNRGVQAARYYAKPSTHPAPDGHVERLRDLAGNATLLGRWALSRLARSASRVTSITLRNFLEMAPDPNNRIALSDRVDAFGSRLPAVTHRCGELDRRSIVTLHRVLRREVELNRWGRLHSDLDTTTEPWPIDIDASHHMGATRMGASAASSVVDSDCRLHSTRNVFIAGASVFPTSGCANPTYTIVALALRLGDHLGRTFGVSRTPAAGAGPIGS